MKKTIYHIFLLFHLRRTILWLVLVFACCILPNAYCIAQIENLDVIEDDSPKTEEIDVSDKHLKKLEKLQNFYISQLKKSKIPEKLIMKYQTGLKDVEEEIALIRKERMDYAKKVQKTEPTLLEIETFKVNFRDMDLALTINESPTIYANEIGSWVFNGSVTFLSLEQYNAPITISAEKVLNEKISIGGYMGHFIEKIRIKRNYIDSNEFFAANKVNYKHNYFTFGLKGSYHFFHPLFILNPVKFDLYVTAMAGYTIAAATIPFLDNEKYLIKDVDGTETDGQYNTPQKKGINYGAFVGLRYMYDDNIGFFVEAGYSNTGYVTGGLTIRFLGKNISSSLEEDIIEFKVQIFSSQRSYKLNHKKFKGLSDVEVYKDKKMHIYTVTGEATSYGAATILQAELGKKKFKKSVVVALKNGEIIKVKKALKLLRKSE